jgi:hypothetical protein
MYAGFEGFEVPNVWFLPPIITLVSVLAYSSTVEMEATYSSETSVDFQRTAKQCKVLSIITQLTLLQRDNFDVTFRNDNDISHPKNTFL